MGIEPTSSAWKAEVLPLNYARKALARGTRCPFNSKTYDPRCTHCTVVEGGGFEPPKAKPADLQSAPVDRLGTPPKHKRLIFLKRRAPVNKFENVFQLIAQAPEPQFSASRKVYQNRGQNQAPASSRRRPAHPILTQR